MRLQAVPVSHAMIQLDSQTEVLIAPEPSPAVSGATVAWNRLLVRTVLVLALTMCAYVGVSIWAVRGDLASALETFPARVLPIGVGLVLVGLALRAARWHCYVVLLDWGVPWRQSIAVFLASFAFTATPGKAGEVVKSFLLRSRYRVSLAEGFGVLLVERLGDLLAVMLLAIAGVRFFADAMHYIVLAALLVTLVAVVAANQSVYRPLLAYVGRLPRLQAVVLRLTWALDACHALLAPLPFLLGAGIALLAWSCEALAFDLIVRGFGLQAHVWESTAIFALATLVGALSALPGGLGSFEVVAVLLLSRLGMPLGSAALAVIVFRTCTLWLGTAIGLAFMAGWLWLSRSNDRLSARGAP